MTSEQIQKTTSKGEIFVNEILFGVVEGLRFKPTNFKNNDESDKPVNDLEKAIDLANKEIGFRIERLIDAPNDEILLASDGYLRWRGEIIANLAEGETLFSPKIIVLADKNIQEKQIEQISERLNLWLSHHINIVLEQIKALDNPAELNESEKQALELTKQLAAHFGILARQKVANLVKSLDQDVRGKLRRLGIKFGAYNIYLPLSLKPAPRELALILFALKNGGIEQHGVSELPHIILSGRTSFEIDEKINSSLYEIAGFKIAGKRAVRIDILERLADLIRPLITLNPLTIEGDLPLGAAEKNGFRVTVEMTSLLGCAGDDFSSILKSLGYRVKRTAIEAEPVKTEPAETSSKEKNDKLEDISTIDISKDTEKSLETSESKEIKYDEVWFPAFYKSEHTKQSLNKNTQKQFNKKPKQKAKGNNTNKHHFKTRTKEKPIDPDSPFAALLALKNKS